MIHPTKIIGHNEQLKILNESYHVQFPHAWVFNGIKGIGKYSTAVSFIRSVCKIKGSNTQNFFEIMKKYNFYLYFHFCKYLKMSLFRRPKILSYLY